MKSLKLKLDQVKVVSFSTGDDSSSPVELPAENGTFERGCDTWAFSCGGTCVYTCKGGFC